MPETLTCDCCGDEDAPTTEVRDCGCAFCDCCYDDAGDGHALRHGPGCVEKGGRDA